VAKEQEEVVRDYLALLTEFVENRLSGAEFERRFLNKYKQDKVPPTEEVFLILDEFFGFVDIHCPDPEILRQAREDDIEPALSTDELKQKAAMAIDSLNRALRD
jgi:hypothetical protein